MKNDVRHKESKKTLNLLLALTQREIKVRYKHAAIGFLWIVINPVLQMIAMGIVFHFFLHLQIKNYFLYLLNGLLLWNYFALSLAKVTPAIVFELPLIEKSKFPRELIIISIIIANLFHTTIAFILLEILSFFIAGINLIAILTTFLVILWVTLILIGLGLLTSALNVRYRDINFITQAILPIWFYATPIIYSINMVPNEFHLVKWLNPLTSPFGLLHSSLGWGEVPEINLILSNFGLSCIVLLLGIWIFKRESPFFDDWV